MKIKKKTFMEVLKSNYLFILEFQRQLCIFNVLKKQNN